MRKSNVIKISLLLLAIVVMLLVPYATGYGNMKKDLLHWVRLLWTNPDWQHCAFVPFLSVFLLYKDKDVFSKFEKKPSNTGFIILLLALFVYYAGYKTNYYYLGWLAVHMLVVSFVLFWGGIKGFKIMLFHILFLGFVWPLHFTLATLGFELRVVVCKISEIIFNFMGEPTIRSGTGLYSAATDSLALGERFQVGVAAPCSGIRSLVALMLLSAVCGFFAYKEGWKRILTTLLAVPLAILGNVVRIILLTYGSIFFGSEFAIGSEHDPSTFHMLAGIAVFIVALTLLLQVIRMLKGESMLFKKRKKTKTTVTE